MRIKNIVLKDFKRFTDLHIGELPASARLVMMVGPHGSGKSSVFDAMNTFARTHYEAIDENFRDYYVKTDSIMNELKRIPMPLFEQMQGKVQIQLHPGVVNWQSGLYIRSAYRNVPSAEISELHKVDESQHLTRLSRLIDNDPALSLNLQRIAWQEYSDLHSEERADMTARQIRERIVGRIRNDLGEILPLLRFDGLDKPGTERFTFRFTKGSAERSHFPMRICPAAKRRLLT